MAANGPCSGNWTRWGENGACTARTPPPYTATVSSSGPRPNGSRMNPSALTVSPAASTAPVFCSSEEAANAWRRSESVMTTSPPEATCRRSAAGPRSPA